MSKLNEAIQIFLKEIGAEPMSCSGISTDSRHIKEGDLYIALVGEKFDGHDFIRGALDAGASLALSQKDSELDNVVKVKDTLLAYHRIANIYRRILNPLVIAITGSNGKTTTKDLMSLVLGQKYKVHATEKNFNNEIGVPKTILEMPEDAKLLILEMGMRGLGQIDLLSRTAEPNIAAITNFGTAHIELLGSKENIMQAKLEIKNGLCAHESYKGTPLFYKSTDCEAYELPEMNCFVSEGLELSINMVTKIASFLGLGNSIIDNALEKYDSGEGRGRMFKLGDLTFIDETYNSSPESIRNAADALNKSFSQRNKILVLGDVNESLPDLVEEAFSYVKSLENERFKLLDARAKSIDQIKAELDKITEPMSVVLVKASREYKLEKLFEKALI